MATVLPHTAAKRTASPAPSFAAACCLPQLPRAKARKVRPALANVTALEHDFQGGSIALKGWGMSIASCEARRPGFGSRFQSYQHPPTYLQVPENKRPLCFALQRRCRSWQQGSMRTCVTCTPTSAHTAPTSGCACMLAWLHGYRVVSPRSSNACQDRTDLCLSCQVKMLMMLNCVETIFPHACACACCRLAAYVVAKADGSEAQAQQLRKLAAAAQIFLDGGCGSRVCIRFKGSMAGLADGHGHGC